MKKLLTLSFMLVLLITSNLFCQNEEKAKRPADPSQALEAISMAKSIALIGYETQNPLYLINAAQLLIDNPTSVFQFETETEANPADLSVKTVLMKDFNAKNLLNDAKLFTKGDDQMLQLIEKMEKNANASISRGAVGGAKSVNRTVDGEATNMYEVNFIEGELAEILVVGDGDTDLDLYVFDSLENLIEQDDDYTDRCYVSWVPKWTGKYIIVIKNLGPVYNNFTLMTN